MGSAPRWRRASSGQSTSRSPSSTTRTPPPDRLPLVITELGLRTTTPREPGRTAEWETCERERYVRARRKREIAPLFSTLLYPFWDVCCVGLWLRSVSRSLTYGFTVKPYGEGVSR